MITMKLKFIGLILFTILLVGCATYQQPNTATDATVSGSSVRHGLYDWNTNEVKLIDNQTVGISWSKNSEIHVTPGMHRFMILTKFNQSLFSGGPFEARTDVTVTVSPNQHYRFVSEVDSAQIKVWAVNSQGGVASSVVRNNYTPIAD